MKDILSLNSTSEITFQGNVLPIFGNYQEEKNPFCKRPAQTVSNKLDKKIGMRHTGIGNIKKGNPMSHHKPDLIKIAQPQRLTSIVPVQPLYENNSSHKNFQSERHLSRVEDGDCPSSKTRASIKILARETTINSRTLSQRLQQYDQYIENILERKSI